MKVLIKGIFDKTQNDLIMDFPNEQLHKKISLYQEYPREFFVLMESSKIIRKKLSKMVFEFVNNNKIPRKSSLKSINNLLGGIK